MAVKDFIFKNITFNLFKIYTTCQNSKNMSESNCVGKSTKHLQKGKIDIHVVFLFKWL